MPSTAVRTVKEVQEFKVPPREDREIEFLAYELWRRVSLEKEADEENRTELELALGCHCSCL